MLPETSNLLSSLSLPLLQPPTSDFINNQFANLAATANNHNHSDSHHHHHQSNNYNYHHLFNQNNNNNNNNSYHHSNPNNYSHVNLDLNLLTSQSVNLSLSHQSLELESNDQNNNNVDSQNNNNNLIIQVECGNNVGYMDLRRLCQGSKGSCIYYNGVFLTPNEFQQLSGRESAKDWKRSIRHNGKSLKLLIKRNLISVHSSSCDCFHTDKITPMEDNSTTSNDDESSGKSSPIDSMKLTSIINKIKSSMKAENGQDDEKSSTNNSSGLNLNEKPNKRRRRDAGTERDRERERERERERDRDRAESRIGERASPSDSTHGGGMSDSETTMKRSPPPAPRNYSDFMRSLAAKYNNHLPIEPPTPQPATLFSRQQMENNRFLQKSLIDMSSTTTLLHLVRSADLKKYHQTPLDLTNNNNNNITLNNNNNNGSSNGSSKKESNCCSSQEVLNILNWSVDEVVRFVSSIDLCKEYAEKFRTLDIDGSGLPLLTDGHLTEVMGMKLGQALKFKSVLQRRLGNCIVCNHHCPCHTNNNSNNNNNSISNIIN